jgi:hypothetical protein
MATITSDTWLDGGVARTAGEAWTCNGGKLTVRTDSRWHANAPASMTGSLGNITVSATLGGGVEFNATSVRWLPYSTGTGNVPAIGTTISRSGVTGYFLGVWSGLNVAPTAVGSAMPVTGFIKLREVTGGPFSIGALTGIGANSTAADRTGWIEVVMDQAATITVSRKGTGTVTRGDWFYLDDTTGVVGQQIQTPTNGGGATTIAPGIWIETGVGTNNYNYWPCLSGSTNGWAAQHIGQPTGATDGRVEFVKDATDGKIQIGEAYETASLAYTITTVSATYTWAANVATVTFAAHGLAVGEQVYLDFTSGGATADGIYTIVTVPSTSTFTVALTGSGTAGNVSYRAQSVVTMTAHPFAVGNTFYINSTSGSMVSGVFEVVATATNTLTFSTPLVGATAGNCTLRLTIGRVPPAGCKTRIPNVILRQCTTGARATNAAPNATLATRPDFTTTGAGIVDHEYTYGDWYYLTSQAYKTRLINVATFDAISVSECATRFELINGGSSMYSALDNVVLTLTSNFAGGQITDWHSPRGNVPGTSDHAVSISTCSGGIDFLRGRSGIVQFARSTGYPVSASQSQTMSFDQHVVINGPLSLATCAAVDIRNVDCCERYRGVTNSTGFSAVTLSAKCSDILVDGMTSGLGGIVPRVFPYVAWVSVTACDLVDIRNIGTQIAPSTTLLNGRVNPASAWTSGGNNSNITAKRLYMGLVRTGPSVTVNSDNGVLEESVFAQKLTTTLVTTMSPTALNNKVRGCGAGANSVAANASVYGTHVYDIFTSDTTGRVVCVFNEATSQTATQVTTVGTPLFTSTPSLSNPTLNDEVIVEMDYFAKGHTALANIAPTLTGTNTGNMAFTYQINTGSGYNGTWLALTGANLSSHTISPSTGFRIKFRVVTTVAATTNAITHIRIDTTSTYAAQSGNLYPLDSIAAALALNGLRSGSEVRVFRTSDDVELAGVESSGTSFSYNYTWTGSDTTVYIVIHALGWLPIRYENVVLGSAGVILPIQQVIDRAYVNP